MKRIINDLKHWSKAKEYLKANNYYMFQNQHDTDHPEGFNVLFCHEDSTIHIVTYNPDVQKGIIEYKDKK